MNAFGHIIDNKEVIGIGPLMREISSDSTMWHMYKRQTLYYLVYARTRDIKVQSASLDMGHPDKTCSDDARALYDEFKAEYLATFKRVAEKIGEPDLRPIGE
jgi:hypothetical protein